MRVFYDFSELPELKNVVFTQGTFDGVHIGHQELLNKLKIETEKISGESLVLTFWPHPRLFLFPDDQELRLLQTLDEKLDVLAACGVDNVLVLKFDKNLSHIYPEDYIKDVLVSQLNVKVAIVGYDHRFGRNREGDIQLLKKLESVYDYKVLEIPAEDINEITVSSTKIRKALNEGDIETANSYLGHPYSFKGKVVKGMQLGRKLGYPTANIEVDYPYKLIPANGVYVVKCLVKGQWYGGMMNIGNNPTVEGKSFSIEVHLFDFEMDIYGETIVVSMVSRLRDEKKFDSLEELSLFLQIDEKNAIERLKNP
jgi:riboflavin kinase / FMN adenylyltransferase